MKRLIALALVLMLTVGSLTSCLFFGAGDLIDLLLDPTPGYYTYQDFTDGEKALFQTHVGLVIPFAPTDEYDVSGYYGEDNYEDGMRFCAYGNTEEDFEEYKALYSDYELVHTQPDDDGDLWYTYIIDGVIVDMSFYFYGGSSVIDVLVYLDTYQITDMGVLTNEGKGLPDGENGIYPIDFSKAEHADNVGDLYNYDGGCPTVGNPKVLVIPVEFKDATAKSKGYKLSNIRRAFTGGAGETDYYSVDEYYKLSSYGQLDLDITILDEWFMPQNRSSYYKDATMDYYGEEINIGDQLILNEALDYLDERMDLSEFDSDGNGIIDAVVMINTLNVDDDQDFHWAYRYWNLYTDENEEFYEYDGVRANDYLWIAYGFMHEKVSLGNRHTYYDTSVMNPFTFIHEFGHILGANDYYNMDSTVLSPMQGLDIMDETLGDHNPFTKFHYGWIKTSRLVTTDGSITLTLKPFTTSGDTVILATNWDDTLGAYQEYYVIAYYTKTGLNNVKDGYFDESCIVVYHVNASLYYEASTTRTFYYLNNDNSALGSEYYSARHLIELQCTNNPLDYSFGVGATMPQVKDDLGNRLEYNIRVVSLSDGEAKITITKN